jgi:hypothetical protein
VILTSGLPRERVGDLPFGVDYMPKPWQPLNLLLAAEQSASVCVISAATPAGVIYFAS